ncbi:hypothetical protein MOV08_08215 [Streptomyces yunnanensis]|uniref:Uncharacterized protein n=1 Tax=Streptomyces yunnanensis TaxID=156453 RepID=A0ABY8A3K0_9ACTN|nr:hypothetical protein [Streptomyces yunnanensis]WEB39259.1 hypothetical protein MOV08_08215 [Streptomyces yunnanensis]
MRLMSAGCWVGATCPIYLGVGLMNWSENINQRAFHLSGSLIQAAAILLVVLGSSVTAVFGVKSSPTTSRRKPQ